MSQACADTGRVEGCNTCSIKVGVADLGAWGSADTRRVGAGSCGSGGSRSSKLEKGVGTAAVQELEVFAAGPEFQSALGG